MFQKMRRGNRCMLNRLAETKTDPNKDRPRNDSAFPLIGLLSPCRRDLARSYRHAGKKKRLANSLVWLKISCGKLVLIKRIQGMFEVISMLKLWKHSLDILHPAKTCASTKGAFRETFLAGKEERSVALLSACRKEKKLG